MIFMNFANRQQMNKDFLLNKSKTFCMFPWLHLNVTPRGDVYPCCSSDYTDPFANVNDASLAEIFNSERMRQLRLDMLSEKPSKICTYCYKHEENSPFSFRKYSIEHFGNSFDNLIPNTQADGTVSDFQMKYFDVRFSNICNMKCRTCGAEFSSKWAQEMKQHDNVDSSYRIVTHADNTGKLIDEIKSQIPNIELAYFAGGEPLITEEHYIILEEMIRTGRNQNITLRYNTNMSNFKYKKYNILDLWSRFKRVEISASIDHYGERAEYIRHGTDWGIVESNLKSIRDLDYINYQYNTVLSVFNYATFDQFYQYLIDKDLLRNKDMVSVYRALTPDYFVSTILPEAIKKVATDKLKKLHKFMIDNDWYQAMHVDDAITFTNSTNNWAEQKSNFQHHILRRDRIRGEDFSKTFPELLGMISG
jgi:MoaA/NifB/PqqE/SkfB family radical SAM enzyme